MSWVVYATLAALLAGLVPLFGKIGVQGVTTNVATIVRAGFVFTALLALTLVWAAGYRIAGLDRRALLFLALSGLAGVGSWLCFFRALQLGDAVRVAAIDRLSAAVTLAGAIVLLQERAPLSAWVGTLLMVLGALLIARS
jgi:transporter family protein